MVSNKIWRGPNDLEVLFNLGDGMYSSFFLRLFEPYLKVWKTYSCCFWRDGVSIGSKDLVCLFLDKTVDCFMVLLC